MRFMAPLYPTGCSDRRRPKAPSQSPPISSPYSTARTTPLPSCGDPARVRRRGQTAPAGGPDTPDTMARRWLGRRAPGPAASDITTRARRGARPGGLAAETQRPRARGRPVRPAARGARGCDEWALYRLCSLRISEDPALRADHFIRGSSASRRPSPKRLKPSTVTKIARPGNRANHGFWWMKATLALRSHPQLGVGGWVPSPRNDRVASTMIDVAVPSVVVTMIGASELGSTWLKRIDRSRAPRARHASMYSFSLIDSALPRTRRA